MNEPIPSDIEFIDIDNQGIRLRVAARGSGPLILCVHGWPELWYSWRHQIACFSERGYRVAAMDVRGYGGSSHPAEIEAYKMIHLASDVVAVIRGLGYPSAILFGHDWGAPVVWNTSLLHPDSISAVAGLSVPYFPPNDTGGSAIDLWRQLYADRFFYQLYFQQTGVAERELERDVTTSLRKIYHALSGHAELNKWIAPKAVDAGLLDGMEDPDPYPEWLGSEDLAVYVRAFEASGFRGPINRYRAQVLDGEDLGQHAGARISQPATFIAGSRDVVRSFIPGSDMYADPGVGCADFRGSTIIDGVGHWVQQEAPEETNLALAAFLDNL